MLDLFRVGCRVRSHSQIKPSTSPGDGIRLPEVPVSCLQTSTPMVAFRRLADHCRQHWLDRRGDLRGIQSATSLRPLSHRGSVFRSTSLSGIQFAERDRDLVHRMREADVALLISEFLTGAKRYDIACIEALGHATLYADVHLRL